MTLTPVTLASRSSARQMILKNAGVAFEAVSPGVDEDAAKAGLLAEEVTPRDIADALAEMKAVKVSAKRPGLVIGADQTLDLKGKLFDKAENLAQAPEHLLERRRPTQKLSSAVVVALHGRPI